MISSERLQDHWISGHLHESTLILGACGVCFRFYFKFDEIPMSKQNSVTSGVIWFTFVSKKGHQAFMGYM